jgi:IS30 family transposase
MSGAVLRGLVSQRSLTDLSACSQADLNRTALQLNQRPRRTLAFRSPAEVLNESVALTG